MRETKVVLNSVQLGPILLDDAVLPIGGAVLLAVLGILGKHFSEAAAEGRKRRIERRNSRLALERQALEFAFSWLDPLDRAIDANLESFMTSQRITIRRFCNAYDLEHVYGYRVAATANSMGLPQLGTSEPLSVTSTIGALQEISKLQPPENLRALLPDDLFLHVRKMAAQIDALYVTPDTFQSLGPYIVGALLEFRLEVNSLRQQLKKRYLKVAG